MYTRWLENNYKYHEEMFQEFDFFAYVKNNSCFKKCLTFHEFPCSIHSQGIA